MHLAAILQCCSQSYRELLVPATELQTRISSLAATSQPGTAHTLSQLTTKIVLFCHVCHLCLPSGMQIVGRFTITPDPTNPLGFSESSPEENAANTPATAELDQLLWLDCALGNRACAAYRDVGQFLPNTRTRIRFRSGHGAGLFVWHW